MNKEAFIRGYLANRREAAAFKDTSARLSEALKSIQTGNFDVPVRSGLHRARIQGDLPDEHLKRLGFFKSILAVPERGQSQWTTWRNIKDNSHLHKHDKDWYMHQDKYPSIAAVLLRRKKNIASGGKKKSLRELLGSLMQGASHAIFEGLPGYQNYTSAKAGGAPTFTDATKMGKDDYILSQLLGAAVD